MVLLSAPSCGGASALDDIARGVRSGADDVDALSTSRWVPRRFEPPPPPRLPSPDEVAAQGNRIALPANELPEDEAKQTIDLACEAVAAMEAAGGSSEDAFNYAVSQTKGAAANRVALKELLDNLEEADNGLVVSAVLGKAALCTWASQ